MEVFVIIIVICLIWAAMEHQQKERTSTTDRPYSSIAWEDAHRESQRITITCRRCGFQYQDQNSPGSHCPRCGNRR